MGEDSEAGLLRTSVVCLAAVVRAVVGDVEGLEVGGMVAGSMV